MERLSNEGLAPAKALGWFSVGLGLAEIAAPRQLASLIGTVDQPRHLLRALGVREVANGAMLLRKPSRTWLWARVAGDIIDLALLTAAFRSLCTNRKRLTAATAAVGAVTLVDILAAARFRGGASARDRSIHVTRVITVNRPIEQVYAFWRNFENLPRFMAHLQSVAVQDGRSHWKTRAPAGVTVEWDAMIVDDQPNRAIVWATTEEADVDHTGSVTFTPAPGGRGTEVRVELAYQPPGGRIGVAIAKLFGEEPGQQIEGDLRRFKQVLETGEVMR